MTAAVIEGTLAKKALVTKLKFYRLEDGFLDYFPNEEALKLSGRIFLEVRDPASHGETREPVSKTAWAVKR